MKINNDQKSLISKGMIDRELAAIGRCDLDKISIRELVRLVGRLEKASGIKFFRMEMGVPGLPSCNVGTEAEIAALKSGVASQYPPIDGIPELKTEASTFAKHFLNLDIAPEFCVPTVGAMQGSFASFMVSCRKQASKDTTLFIDPGFPVQKQQHHVLGLKQEGFDLSEHRGERLRDVLESRLSFGDVSTIIYSNPNNPSWMCLSDNELKIIGELSEEHDVTVVEDLAYFGMDFRQNFHRPGRAPFQPSVCKYTSNYVILVSSSKIFSYAGQRIGMMFISPTLFNREFPDLKRYFSFPEFGHCMIYGALYSLSSGTAHSAQHALAAMLKAVNEGKYDLREALIEYSERAREMKRAFKENGFRIVYEADGGEPIADGFFFTISYPGMEGNELIGHLLGFGISAISLDITGSKRPEGLRACVSLIHRNQIPELETRLAAFNSLYGRHSSVRS